MHQRGSPPGLKIRDHARRICYGLVAFSAYLLGAGQVTGGASLLVSSALLTVYFQLKQPFPNLEKVSLTAVDHLKANACADSATGIMITDQEDRILYTNLAFQRLTGYSEQELLGQWPCDLFHPLEEDLPRREAVFACASKRLPFSGEIEIRRKDGSLHWIATDMNPVVDEDGAFKHYVSSNTDISQRKATEAVLEENEARFRAGMEAIQSGVVMQDGEGKIIYCNEQAKEILKIEEGLIGQYSSDPRLKCINSNGEEISTEEHPCMKVIATGLPQTNVQLGLSTNEGQLTWITVNAMPIFDAQGKVTGIVNSIVDITQRLQMEDQVQHQLMTLTENQIEMELQAAQLEQLNSELERLATRDGLTDLLNRRTFDRRISELFSESHDVAPGLILLDVDHFKPFNDNFGHQAGDTVLQKIGEVLAEQKPFVDSAYRYGGEEFAIILTDGTPNDYMVSAEGIRLQIEQEEWPHRAVTVSMGLALINPETTPQSWLRSADSLLYHAKEMGRNQVVSDPLPNQDRIAA